MNPQEQALLQQLNDIATPAQPGWWPLAIGWWVLAALCVVLLFLLWKMVKKKTQHQQAQVWRDLALAEHQRIRNSLSDVKADDNSVLSELSVLMRRVALAVLPRSQIAAATDQQWLAALDSLGNTREYSDGVGQLLDRAPYKKHRSVAEEDLSQLLDLTEATIVSAEISSASQQESAVAAL